MKLDGTDEDTVLEAFRDGRLPLRQPDRQWGGNGSGAHCSICGELIGTSALEFELEFDGDDDAAGRHHVHVRCFTEWERLVLSPAVSNIPHARKAGSVAEPLRLSARDGQINISARDYAASTQSADRVESGSDRDARGLALSGRQRGPSGRGTMG